MKYLFTFLISFPIATSVLYASDTTYHKKPWFLSLNIGYGTNTVGGSMVDFDKGYSPYGIIQQNKWGMAFNSFVSKNFTTNFYFKTGLGYVQKNVNPQVASGAIYKDSLNTSYLTVPALVGTLLPLDNKKKVAFFLQTGLGVNFKLSDKSYTGPDRISLTANSGILNFQLGCGFDFALDKKVDFEIQYQYSTDLNSAYTEVRSFGNDGRAFGYKYNSSLFSLGLRMRI